MSANDDINPDDLGLARMLDFTDPDLHALLLTYKHVGELLRADAPPAPWRILKSVLVDHLTPDELAKLLLGSCVIHARSLATTEPK